MSWQPSGAGSGEREKGKFISAQKLCPSHHCTYRLEIDLQRAERSYCVEKPRGQCLKRVIDIPVGWFRMQHAYIDVFVACEMQSSKAVVSLADTMHRRHFILEISPPLSFFSNSLSSFSILRPSRLYNEISLLFSTLGFSPKLHRARLQLCARAVKIHALAFFFPLVKEKKK